MSLISPARTWPTRRAAGPCARRQRRVEGDHRQRAACCHRFPLDGRALADGGADGGVRPRRPADHPADAGQPRGPNVPGRRAAVHGRREAWSQPSGVDRGHGVALNVTVQTYDQSPRRRRHGLRGAMPEVASSPRRSRRPRGVQGVAGGRQHLKRSAPPGRRPPRCEEEVCPRRHRTPRANAQWRRASCQHMPGCCDQDRSAEPARRPHYFHFEDLRAPAAAGAEGRAPVGIRRAAGQHALVGKPPRWRRPPGAGIPGLGANVTSPLRRCDASSTAPVYCHPPLGPGLQLRLRAGVLERCDARRAAPVQRALCRKVSLIGLEPGRPLCASSPRNCPTTCAA